MFNNERNNMNEPFKIDMYFMIRYYAKKHSKTITRRAKYDADTGNKYRTAVNYEVLA